MKIKQVVLGCVIAALSTTSMAGTSTQSTLVNFTTDKNGILFSTTYRGDSPCVQRWGNEYRISLEHPNYKALASTLLAISLDPENSPFTFSFASAFAQVRLLRSNTECFHIDSISRYIGV